MRWGRLCIGVTGHRLNNLAPDAREPLAAAVARTLDVIDACRRDVGARRRPVLFTSLAEGVDRYAVTAALARRWPIASIIPYALTAYRNDFTYDASWAEFTSMISRSREVVVLDGAAIDRARGEYMGYAAAGAALQDFSDVLLAVWNGAPPNGPGGTAEVCALAADAGKPIVWVSPDGASARLILSGAPAYVRSARRRLHDALAARFESVARPAEMRRAG